MRLPAVRRAVNVIAGDLARMPVKAYQYQGDQWTDVGRDPITIALNEQASEYHTATEWKRWTFAQTLLWGNSFTLISRRANSFDQFIPLNHADVQMNRNTDGSYFYTTSEYGEVAGDDVDRSAYRRQSHCSRWERGELSDRVGVLCGIARPP